MAILRPIFNRRARLLASGKGTIDIRVTIERKPYYLATGFHVFPIHWDEKTQRVNTKCPNFSVINEAINAFLIRASEYSSLNVRHQKQDNFEDIRRLWSGEVIDTTDFIIYTREELNVRNDINEKTREVYQNQLKVVESFSKGSLSFDAMNFNWIESFDRYLIGKGLNQNTRWKYHKFIKTFVNSAIKKGITELYGYNEFKVSRKEGSREALTLTELKQLENINREVLSPGEELVLDKFLFSCYTGLRISDSEVIALENFQVEKKAIYLTFKMQKTNTWIRNLPLHSLFNGKPAEIYRKYADSSLGMLFPSQHSITVNRALKGIGRAAGIRKTLTFHMARHTFGTALAEVTGDVFLIKEFMGHSKVETSMIYIHMSPKRMENKLNKFQFNY